MSQVRVTPEAAHFFLNDCLGLVALGVSWSNYFIYMYIFSLRFGVFGGLLTLAFFYIPSLSSPD